MRRLAVGLIAAAMIVWGTSSARAEDLTARPSTGDGLETVGYQRINHPDDGFSISVPPDWDHALAAEADPSQWWDSAVVGDPIAWHETFLADGGILMTRGPSGSDSCHLYDVTEGAAALGFIDLTNALDALDHCTWPEPGPAATATATGFFDLTTGRAAYCDISWRDGWHTREYVYTNDRAWFRLGCGAGSDPPSDRWLSIAETFEFLTAEE